MSPVFPTLCTDLQLFANRITLRGLKPKTIELYSHGGRRTGGWRMTEKNGETCRLTEGNSK